MESHNCTQAAAEKAVRYDQLEVFTAVYERDPAWVELGYMARC